MTKPSDLGSPGIPVRAIVISGLALTIPVVATIAGGGALGRFEALVWLSALIPVFLLAYYRRWSGVVTGLALAMVGFGATQVYLIRSGQRFPDWPYMLAITTGLALGSLVAGWLADRLRAERAHGTALVDPVTGLPNRLYFDVILAKEVAAAQRGRGLVLTLFALDGLDEVDYRRGRSSRDEARKAFADVLRSFTRSMNLSAHLEGDRFGSILSSSTPGGAGIFVERVQHAMDEAQVAGGSVTVRAGMAAYTAGMSGVRDLVDAAERALHDAERSPES